MVKALIYYNQVIAIPVIMLKLDLKLQTLPYL